MKNPITDLGKRLLQAREAAQLTGTDVARILGNSKQTISHWENGRSEISILDLQRVAGIYGVDIEWLITGSTKALRDGDKTKLQRGRIIPCATAEELLSVARGRLALGRIAEKRQTYAEASAMALSFEIIDTAMDGAGFSDGPFRVGHIVAVDRKRLPKPSECVLFVNKTSGDILFRRYKTTGIGTPLVPPFKLTADNPSYEVIDVKSAGDLVFLGTLIEHVILAKS